MVNFTRGNLKKIEEIFESLEYEVLYEKGHFNSGYCIVHDQKIIVVNKFYDIEGRINVLVDILTQIEYDESLLTDSGKSLLKKLALVENE